MAFRVEPGGTTSPAVFVSPFDVMPDGARFVAVRPTRASALDGGVVNRNHACIESTIVHS